MDEDSDSRTASFERKRPHADSDNDPSGDVTSTHSTPRKRLKRRGKAGGQDLRDFVPVGGNFSTRTAPLGDADDSRSDDSSGSGVEKNGGVPLSQASRNLVGAAPSINWNVGSKAKIRTRLGGSGAAKQTTSRATSQSAPTSQAEAKESPVQASPESTPRQTGTLTIHGDGQPFVALDPSIPEIPGTKNGLLSSNVKLLNPPLETVHKSTLDNYDDPAPEQIAEDGGGSDDGNAVVLNLQSEQESGEITEGDTKHKENETSEAQAKIGRMEVDQQFAPNEKEQRGPPEVGISSENKVMVTNLPYDLSENQLRESFLAYNPIVVDIALRPIPRSRAEKGPKHNEPRMGRGFGFVSFATEGMRQKVISEMEGREIKGRKISVKVAVDRSDKEAIGSGAGGSHQKGNMTSEEDQTDAMMGYSASESTKAIPHTTVANDNASIEKHQPRILADLVPEELKLQLKYFYITKNPWDVDPHSAVRCLVCTQEGHLAESCETLLCAHCGRYKNHFSRQCPQNQKCHKCHERGHMQEQCPYKLGRLAANELVCDLCQRKGHTEAKCELLWRTSGKPWDSDISKMSVRRSCYECGSNTHLGNDCPTRKPGKPMGSSTWSLGENQSGPEESRASTVSKGRAQQKPVALVEDSDDEQANFYRPRIPPPARSGQIRVANDNLGRYQGSSWTPTNESQRDYRTGGRRDESYRDLHDYGSNAYRPNERRHSLSPQPRYPERGAPRGGYDGSDDRKPPLPRGPPPGRAGKGGRGPAPGGKTYKPMPSAAKSAWSRHRT